MKKIRMNHNWEFWKDGCEMNKQVIHLPHDAMQLEKRVPDLENGAGSGYYPGGKYWYKKTFFGSEEFCDSSAIVEFEGVYMDSTVWLNGQKVGGHVYGYSNFFADLTDKVRLGEKNELLVLVDNSKQPNSRWYTGSGIYRPVNLWLGGRCHIAPLGLRVKTLSCDPAIIRVCAELEGGRANVVYRVLDGEQVVATAYGVQADITIENAKLWSADMPNLYTLQAEVMIDGVTVDRAQTRFGIRTIEWSVENGLQINGKSVKLKGGCIHHDNGILGACAYDKAEYRKMKKLKEFGFNAVRYSHCPAGQNLLDACDELGMYVMDETFDQWRVKKNTFDYSTCFDSEHEKDVAAMAIKDYNHPSVILYSIGNEIPDTGRSYAAELAQNMVRILKEIDGTRPVTMGNNGPMSLIAKEMEGLEQEKGAPMGSLQINELITANPGIMDYFKKNAFSGARLEEITGKVFDELDIAGHNYAHSLYEGIRGARPDRIIVSAETFPQRMASNWKTTSENSWCIGDFHWTAWDYLGEAGVGLPVYGTKEAPFSKPYPCLTAACGSFDLIGDPEAAAYYCAILWGVYGKPYIGVRPVEHSGEDYTIGGWRLTNVDADWTWPGCEGRKAQIVVYSIGAQIELIQNGVCLGKHDLVDCMAAFETDYQPGSLEAVSYDEAGNEIGRSVLHTAGSPAELLVCPEEDRILADCGQIIFVPIRIVDSNGSACKRASDLVRVEIEGPGELIALGSARYETEEDFRSNTHSAWKGSLLAVIRSTGLTGHILVKASAQHLRCAQTEIEVIEP